MAHSQSSVRRRRGDLLNVPWAQRKPEDFLASEARQYIHPVKAGVLDGLWRAKVPYPKVKGQPARKPKILGPVRWARIDELITRRDAALAEIRAGGELAKGREAKPLLLKEWISQYLGICQAISNLAGNTIDGYRVCLGLVTDREIGIGEHELPSLTREDIEGWIARARAKGHSISFINEALRRLKTCLKAAVARHKATKLSASPAADIKPIPNRDKVESLANYRTHPSETMRLVDAAYERGDDKREWSYLLELPLIATDLGLRVSEICALTWGDVFLDAPNPYVRLSHHLVASGEGDERIRRLIPGTKASDGRAETVYLSKRAAAALRRTRARLLAYKALRGRKWRAGHTTDTIYSSTGKAYVIPAHPLAPEALVFPSRQDGSPFMTSSLASWFEGTVCRRAGITTKSIHSLRHDCATFLLTGDPANGIPPAPLVIVSNHMRHANSSITAKTYAHLLNEQESVAPSVFDLIGQAQEARLAAV